MTLGLEGEDLLGWGGLVPRLECMFRRGESRGLRLCRKSGRSFQGLCLFGVFECRMNGVLLRRRLSGGGLLQVVEVVEIVQTSNRIVVDVVKEKRYILFVVEMMGQMCSRV